MVQAFSVQAKGQGATIVILDSPLIEPTERGFLQELGNAIGLENPTFEEVIGQLEILGPRVFLVIETYELFRLMDTWLRQVFVPALSEKDVSFTRPELPRVSVDTRMPEQRGGIIKVPADGDLQQAVHNARLGDTIILQAGATYEGTFVLPNKEGDGWIVVKSSAEGRLPDPGTRVTPAFAEHMPKLVTNHNGQPCLRTQPGVGVPMVLISGRLAAERVTGPDPQYRSKAWR